MKYRTAYILYTKGGDAMNDFIRKLLYELIDDHEELYSACEKSNGKPVVPHIPVEYSVAVKIKVCEEKAALLKRIQKFLQNNDIKPKGET